MAFGGVWKESLTELSGGQRSLLALSLILAMLLFKPAPIYILDEVPCLGRRPWPPCLCLAYTLHVSTAILTSRYSACMPTSNMLLFTCYCSSDPAQGLRLVAGLARKCPHQW